MEARKTSKWEYLKQPHVAAVGLLVCLAIIGAIYTGYQRIQHMRHVANLGTYDACMEFVDDDNLCRHAEANQKYGSSNYTITTTTSDGKITELSVLEVENPDRLKSVTMEGPIEIEAFINIDDTTYAKDLDDGIWAKYTDPNFLPTEESIVYNFTSANSEDVIEFRDYYSLEGSEPCGNLTCLKYKIESPSSAAKIYAWIDTEKFLLRKQQSAEGDLTTSTTFEYRQIKIEAPTPTKDVSAEELESYL